MDNYIQVPISYQTYTALKEYDLGRQVAIYDIDDLPDYFVDCGWFIRYRIGETATILVPIVRFAPIAIGGGQYLLRIPVE